MEFIKAGDMSIPLGSGQWIRLTNDVVTLTCAHCGSVKIWPMDEVGLSGELLRVFDCPNGLCGWRGAVRLRDWRPE